MSNGPQPNSRTPLLAAHHASASRSSSPGPAPSPAILPTLTNSTSKRRRRKRSPPVQLGPALWTIALLALAGFVIWDISLGECRYQWVCRLLGSEWSKTSAMKEVWRTNSGAYAPFSSRGPGGGKRGLPRGCEINQVTILHRHGARYPTTSAANCIRQTLDKIAQREIRIPRGHPELTFISHADLNMTGWKFDSLMDRGRRAMWKSGREFEALYRQFVEKKGYEGLFTRSGGGERVVESGKYWLEGFHGESFKLKPMVNLPDVNVTIPEGEEYNNTLSVHNCPAFDTQDWKDVSGLLRRLEPAADRINKILRPQPALTTSDLLCLSDMCPYDTQAEGVEGEIWSRWCGIFTREEWEIIGHHRDATRYYDVGEASVYGPTMGAGWVNELIARLTDSPVSDSTTVNHTLDIDERAFPRGGRRLFVDFGHDNEMISVLGAMGVLKQKRPLPTTSVPDKRTFITSSIVPFGARIVFERLGCQLGDWEPDPEAPEGGSEDDGRKNYLRIFVNDALQFVDHIACKQSGFVEHGMCEVELFKESQAWSTDTADWRICREGAGGPTL